MKDRWSELLNPVTFRDRSPRSRTDGRNPFENDYGRLISSSSIRRLQDKTQVFPLEQSDFIRTRLTHSLEVSYIGSGIGISIENFLISEGLLDKRLYGNISSLLRVAGLVHDIGNPPFGHFGEVAIHDFFKKYFDERSNTDGLVDQEIEDFKQFDGNAQAFRVLRKLHYFGDEYSFNLTYPSLASIIKYPSNSIDGNKPNSNQIWLKKFGYFISEQDCYNEINIVLKLNNKRHPVVYLLEAADDIAYCAADIEDGVKLGIISFDDIQRIFEENLFVNSYLNVELKEFYKSIKEDGKNKIDVVIQKFRIRAQHIMIESVIQSFKDNYEKIMTGNFEEELIYKSNASDIRKGFKKLQRIVFDNKKIMLTELAGWEAITGLLNIFIPSILALDLQENPNSKENRIFKNISSSYRDIYTKYGSIYYQNDKYNKIQLVLDFIVGMTDSYAISLYQKLKGIKL